MDNPKIIFLMGLPGAGKGTQADLTAEKFNLAHFETSKMIRDKFVTSISEPEVVEAKKLYDRGDLVSPPLLYKWLIEAINKMNIGQGVVFDGSPRTLYEAEKLIPYLGKKFGRAGLLAIDIKIDSDETIWRNTHRRICKHCGKSVPFFPDTKDLKECPICSGPLVIRELDNLAIIKERIDTFNRDTMPAIDYLKKQGLLEEVNGEQEIKKVSGDIVKVIAQHFKQ